MPLSMDLLFLNNTLHKKTCRINSKTFPIKCACTTVAPGRQCCSWIFWRLCPAAESVGRTGQFQGPTRDPFSSGWCSGVCTHKAALCTLLRETAGGSAGGWSSHSKFSCCHSSKSLNDVRIIKTALSSDTTPRTVGRIHPPPCVDITNNGKFPSWVLEPYKDIWTLLCVFKLN